ncbi:hypothetical protein B9Z55_028029 [Caenorhabditis nigoni]|uniref:Uncharacterized protein n=1 Tax=Caenorhabditis nigoni TaxID=1611254 RepID=A0A2G5SDF3_9PELO|nr:hypothetical protein B9Z55_028029 [Caenorhabditis nigoni]
MFQTNSGPFSSTQPFNCSFFPFFIGPTIFLCPIHLTRFLIYPFLTSNIKCMILFYDSQNRLHGEATTQEKRLKKEVEELEEIHKQHPDWDNYPELLEYFKTPEDVQSRIKHWSALNWKRIDLTSARVETSSLEIKVKTTLNASLRTANDELSNDQVLVESKPGEKTEAYFQHDSAISPVTRGISQKVMSFAWIILLHLSYFPDLDLSDK